MVGRDSANYGIMEVRKTIQIYATLAIVPDCFGDQVMFTDTSL